MSQHPINLNLTSSDLDTLNEALTNITLAYEGFHLDGTSEFCERVLPLDRFNELRAYFGAIREAHNTVCEILYGTPDSALDAAPAAGIERPTEDARARIMNQFDRGILTADERDGALAMLALTENGSHPCIQPGCTHVVPYDDEPYCFTHSPDGGSSVRGYSYKASQA